MDERGRAETADGAGGWSDRSSGGTGSGRAVSGATVAG